MAAVTICSDFGAQKNKSATVSTVSPSISHEVMGPDAMILVFWMLSFKPTFSKCFSSNSDNCPDVGIGPLLQFPHPPRAVPALLTLLFFPLAPWSYQVLCGSIYSFPLIRYSCLLSAGVLHALLCLKVYSWCIHGERCTPRPPTPPPSYSPDFIFEVILLDIEF